MSESKYEDKFNIMVIGDEKVGKTTILERHFNRKFNSERKKTVGVEYYPKDYKDLKTELVYNIKFWDTAGQEKFRSVTKNYYQRAQGMIITMAIDNRESFNNLRMWVNSVLENSGNQNMPFVVVCNKMDLDENEKVIQISEVEELCNDVHKDKTLKLKYFFTSAKTGENIDEAFEYIMKEVIKFNSSISRDSTIQPKNIKDKPENPGHSRCCN